ncbi:MAG: efflux RND transporter periplasmic adaptor subunit [Acidobacteriota bacterium]|jgi:multidrug efflux pump subunit AcrA (membrane-fusion protein)|nr:efflux RND transporter periplasmic adaptor subunit [Acidobacteriota bacterium]
MSRFKLFLVSTCVFALAVSCGGKKSDAKMENESEKIVFQTARAVVRDISGSFQANGSFIAEETSDINPAVGGRVEATPVDVGSFVVRGQIICQLEKKDAELRLEQARATLEQAKFMLSQAESRVGLRAGAEFNPENVPEVLASKAAFDAATASSRLAAADARRYENLIKSGDVSQSAFDRVRTQHETAEAAADSARKQYEAQMNAARQSFGAVEAARASLAAAESQLSMAQKNLEDTSVRAPFDGYITDRPATVGQWRGSADKVATMVRISTVKLQLQIPEQRAGMTKNGMEVTARVVAWPDRDFTGRLIAVVPSISMNSRTFLAEARFDNPDAALRPGMYATARVILDEMIKAVFVPSRAVFYDNTTDANHVYTVVNGIARLNVVQTGDVQGNEIRILSGLKGEETVVLDNLADLHDGATVN